MVGDIGTAQALRLGRGFISAAGLENDGKDKSQLAAEDAHCSSMYMVAPLVVNDGPTMGLGSNGNKSGSCTGGWKTMNKMRQCSVLLALVACETGGPGSVDARRVFFDSAAVALAEAAADGDSVRIRELVRAGADPNARGDKGVNPLQWALLNRSSTGMAGLLAAGADPTVAESSGTTVMHYAAMANDPEYLQVLLRHRANPNAPNGVTGATPLMAALMGAGTSSSARSSTPGPNQTAPTAWATPRSTSRPRSTPSNGCSTCSRQGPTRPHATSRALPFSAISTLRHGKSCPDDARRQRTAIAAWLRAHGVPLESPAGR